MNKLYPFKFKAIYKEKIWGGNKLKKKFRRNIPSSKTGESWEITDNESGISIVKNGKLSGRSINELIKIYGKKLLGNITTQKNNFPLLIKFIDASQKLSVQVHPSEKNAKKSNKKNAKTEMWYVLSAKNNAKIVYGLNSNIDNKKLKRVIKNGTLNSYLNEVEVQAGDSFFIPGGTIHAIKGGILLAEIQQNSDTTYRLYDWDRHDKKGNSRTLHINKAFKTINDAGKKTRNHKFKKNIIYKNNNYQQKFLTISPYFTVEHFSLKKYFNFKPNYQRFYVIINLSGNLKISADNKIYKFQPGETILIPASINNVKITGKGEFLRTYIPEDLQEMKLYLHKLGINTDKIYEIPGVDFF
mgnify:CR=1 FL=1